MERQRRRGIHHLPRRVDQIVLDGLPEGAVTQLDFDPVAPFVWNVGHPSREPENGALADLLL